MYKDVCIEERQNKEECIRYLRAQKHAYKMAKQYYITKMILSVFLLIMFVLILIILINVL